jgi:hypothetical protein
MKKQKTYKKPPSLFLLNILFSLIKIILRILAIAFRSRPEEETSHDRMMNLYRKNP